MLPVADPLAELPPLGTAPDRVSLAVWLVNFVAVVVPFLGLIAAALLWGWGFRWVDLGLLLGMYFLTALGITVGFHRLFTHRSFQANRVAQFASASSVRWPWRARFCSGSLCTAGTISTAMRSATPTRRTPKARASWACCTAYGTRRRLGLRARAAGPVSLRQGPPAEPYAARGDAPFLVWVAAGLLIPAVVGGL